MLNYSHKDNFKCKYKYFGEKEFDISFRNSTDGFLVNVDDNKEIKIFIQEHTNPLNEGLVDKKAKFLNNEDIFHMGNIIYALKDKRHYLAITEPKVNNVYSKYRIRSLDDLVKYKINDKECEEKAILASGLLYKDKSYVSQTNVFDDTEMKALILQYNANTKNISVLDTVNVNSKNYKVVQVDNETLKKFDKEYGILQITVLLVPKFKIEKLDISNKSQEEIKSVLKYARVKDKKLNSLARELMCEFNKVKSGDYIKYTYDSNDVGLTKEEIYMVYNMPVKYSGYDMSLVYRCINSFNMLDDNGNIISIPYYFEDNRTRIDRTKESEYVKYFNSTFEIIFQNNSITKQFVNRKIGRVILKGTAYKVMGVSDLDEGLISLGLEVDDMNLSDDEFGVADYHSLKGKCAMAINDLHIKGTDSIFRGHDWRYELSEDINQLDLTWKVDSNEVDIVSFDNQKCSLRLRDKYTVGNIIKLTAKTKYGDISKDILIE